MNILIEKYERLGWRTYFIFLMRRMGFLIIFFLVIGISFFGLKSFFSAAQNPLFSDARIVSGSVLLGLLVSAILFALASLEYIHYAIYLDDNGFRVKRGV